jgi:hypothetical protein
MTNQQLSNEIQRLQDIQRSQPSTRTDAWEQASEALAPLFAEAAKRQAEGRADGIVSL